MQGVLSPFPCLCCVAAAKNTVSDLEDALICVKTHHVPEFQRCQTLGSAMGGGEIPETPQVGQLLAEHHLCRRKLVCSHEPDS